MSLYNNLLHPELYYENPDVARFVETMNEPEIQSASCDQFQQLKQNMMATDDIDTLCELLSTEALEQLFHTGTVMPQFISYPDIDRRIKFCLEQKIPSTPESVKRFLTAGKALAFSRASQCVFFATIQPLKNDEPIFGKDVTGINPFGILIIGSSLRGNCFIHLNRMNKIGDLDFNTIRHDILREGKFDYPYSKFFHIEDYTEMEKVIKQTLKLSNPIPEKECLINFATTLKALDFFGYAIQGS